nr:MAG TPA: hypothetical protein [Caudoviricetes sp.]
MFCHIYSYPNFYNYSKIKQNISFSYKNNAKSFKNS